MPTVGESMTLLQRIRTGVPTNEDADHVEALEARVAELEAAIEWVLKDMSYKAPEQVIGCSVQWFKKLHQTLKP